MAARVATMIISTAARDAPISMVPARTITIAACTDRAVATPRTFPAGEMKIHQCNSLKSHARHASRSVTSTNNSAWQMGFRLHRNAHTPPSGASKDVTTTVFTKTSLSRELKAPYCPLQGAFMFSVSFSWFE